MTAPARIGVIISTYNKPQELKLVLEGWLAQKDRNFAIYVADDGSAAETTELVNKMAEASDIPIRHVWQKDDGFRLSRVRNLAIHTASGCDYLIITDGDCIPLPGMVAAHRKKAEKGCFLNGERLLLSKELSAGLLAHPWPIATESTVKLFTRALKGEINRALPLLLPTMTTAPSQRLHGLRGCHLSFWREDLIRANGFDETYHGWGREDSDMAARLFHLGIHRRNLRGMPLLHLWHHEASRDKLNRNDQLLEDCIRQQRTRALIGLDALDG